MSMIMVYIVFGMFMILLVSLNDKRLTLGKIVIYIIFLPSAILAGICYLVAVFITLPFWNKRIF